MSQNSKQYPTRLFELEPVNTKVVDEVWEFDQLKDTKVPQKLIANKATGFQSLSDLVGMEKSKHLKD